jgi:hypothetical protein
LSTLNDYIRGGGKTAPWSPYNIPMELQQGDVYGLFILHARALLIVVLQLRVLGPEVRMFRIIKFEVH